MKLKLILLIFFVAATNFVFAESKSIEHYKSLIEKWGPVPSVFLETYKNNKLKSTVGFKAETAIEKIGDFIWGFRRGTPNPRLMACRSNQKVLAEAIRTYNQEQSDKIDKALPIIVIVIGFVIVGVLLFKLVAKFAKKSPDSPPIC